MVDKIKHTVYVLHWCFQQNQCLNIKKHAVHNIHRLTRNPGRQLPGVPMR